MFISYINAYLNIGTKELEFLVDKWNTPNAMGSFSERVGVWKA